MEIICETCGKLFERSFSEINRNKNKNRKTYCSRSCSGMALVKNIGMRRDISKLKKGSDRDEYSKFRFFLKVSKMNSSRKNKKLKEHSITLEDLKEQWEIQNGICPYTGWQLAIAETIGQKIDRSPDRASLDRIDSSKGYIKGNIQFVSLIAQYAKNGWDADVLLNFAKAMISHSLL